MIKNLRHFETAWPRDGQKWLLSNWVPHLNKLMS